MTWARLKLLTAFALVGGLAIAAGPAEARVFTVNTAEDIMTGASATDPVAVARATRACVGDVAPGAMDGVAKLIEDQAASPQLNNPPLDAARPVLLGTAPVVRATDDRCSLRMAIIAANATPRPRLVTLSDDLVPPDQIHFDSQAIAQERPDANDAIKVEATLPVIDNEVTIDGCSGAANPTGPCIDVDLTQVAGAQATDVPAGGSLPPGSNPGIVVAADKVEVAGLAIWGGEPALAAVQPAATAALIRKLRVRNNRFGLNTAGAPAGGTEGIGLYLFTREATIGGTAPRDRNVFSSGDTGIVIAGGETNKIQGNYFGTDAAGIKRSGALKTGIRLIGIGLATDEDAGREANVERPRATEPLGRKNIIGPENDAEASPGAATPAVCDHACNLFAGIGVSAIDIGGEPMVDQSDLSDPANNPPTDGTLVNTVGETSGVAETEITGSQFGVDLSGAPAGSTESNIVVRNGAPQTTIGRRASGFGNVLRNSKAAGVRVEPGAGDGTVIVGNSGTANTNHLIDLGDPGAGNETNGPSDGVQPPTITSATTASVSGTAAPSAQIFVYTVPGTRQGDAEKLVGEARASESGAWTAAVSGVGGGATVTATADAGDGTSELARNATATLVTTQQQNRPSTQTPVGQSDQPATSTTPGPRRDSSPPAVTAILGQKPGSREITVSARKLTELTGEVSDPSGVREVFVALRLVEPKSKSKSRSKSKARRSARRKSRRGARAKSCRFVHFSKGSLIPRPCAKPLYTRASGTEQWSLPLTPKVKRLLKPGRRYVLYVRSIDSGGHTSTRQFRLRLT